MTIIQLLASACVSALGFSLSLPNELFIGGFPLGGFFCLTPFFYAQKHADSWQKGALLGFVFGVVFHASSSWWLANFKDYAFWTLGATSILYGVFYGFWGIFLNYSSKPDSESGPLLLAFIWTIMEWQKSNGYFAFPWGLLPYTVQNIHSLIQIADITGVYGLSFLLALCNAAVTELLYSDRKGNITGVFRAKAPSPGVGVCRTLSFLIEKMRKNVVLKHFLPLKLPKEPTNRRFLRLKAEKIYKSDRLLAALLLLIWTFCYGLWRLEHPTLERRKIPIVLVQHNIDQYANESEALSQAIELSRQGTACLEEQGMDAALIVWSETLLTMPFRENSSSPGNNAMSFLEQSKIPVLTGAPIILGESEIANGAILVLQGKIIASYGKRKLIPFAEEIPFSSKEWMRRLMEKFVGFSSGWTACNEAVVMEIQGLRFGTPICFEDAFAGICRDFFKEGAEILINITNDSWSKSVSAEVQHLAAARFRAVENRSTLVRSTNSGCTVVIDAEGRTIAGLPLFSASFLALEIPVQSGGPTVYLLLGDWLPLLCALLFAGNMIMRGRDFHRQVTTNAGTPLTADAG